MSDSGARPRLERGVRHDVEQHSKMAEPGSAKH